MRNQVCGGISQSIRQIRGYLNVLMVIDLAFRAVVPVEAESFSRLQYAGMAVLEVNAPPAVWVELEIGSWCGRFVK